MPNPSTWKPLARVGPSQSKNTPKIRAKNLGDNSVFKVVYPDDPDYLWTELQTSTTVRKVLGDETVCPHLIEVILELWQKHTIM